MGSPIRNTPRRFTDQNSGIEIVELVPDAESSIPLSYDWPSVTPDNRYAVIRCTFSGDSGHRSGFYRVATDGVERMYLSPEGIHPRLTPDGRFLYTLATGDPILRRVDLSNGRAEDVCTLERVLPEGFVYVQMRLSPATNHLFVMLRDPDITPIRVELSTGDCVRLDGFHGMFWACSVDDGRVVAVRMKGAEQGRAYTYTEYRKLEQNPGDRSLWSLDVDGADARLICTDLYSHATMHGRTPSVQGCGKWGDRSITICSEGNRRRTVCEGPYFWHSGAAFDGDWIVADTNWPDYGIQLIHVPTGNFRYLCDHGSSLKTGLLHAHPSLSNDGRIAMFRSDRSGACQAYLVRISEDFRESVIAGNDEGTASPVWFRRM